MGIDIFAVTGNVVFTAVLFIIVLGLLVFVHELGHFVTALRMGIGVEEFGFGYPPRARVLFERGGVKYTLNWLPLGGFVRMVGEEGNYEARNSLAAAPPWRKIPVMVAGPAMNVVLAVLIFAGMFMVRGVPTPQPGVRIQEIFVGSPASRTSLQVDDILLAINDAPVETIDDVARLSQRFSGDEVMLLVDRAGAQQRIPLTPGRWVSPEGRVFERGLGISYGDRLEYVRANPLQAIWEATVYSFVLMGRMLVGLGQLIASLFGGPAVPGGVAGPLGIARGTAEVARMGGLEGVLNWTAILSLNLALINMLPIPALDGSRIVFALLEWVRRGKRVPPEREAMVHALGFMMLMGLMVLISISDVANAIQGRPVIGGS